MGRNELRDIFSGTKTLLAGLRITMRHFFKKPVTVEYPSQRTEMSAAFRSAIAQRRFEESGTHDCIACQACQRVCPSTCIVVDGEKPEGLKRKRATKFEVDFALCSLCGLCIDVCPTDTLVYSKTMDAAGFRRESFVLDLLEPFRDGEAAYLSRAREEEARKEAEKKAAAAAKAAADAAAKAQAAAQTDAADAAPPSAGPAGMAPGTGEPTPSPAV